MKPPRTAIILVNLGTPDAPTAASCRRFLAEFLHDHRVITLTRWLWCPILHGVILRLRPKKLAEAYQSIWSSKGSPLREHTVHLTEQVQQRCIEQGLDHITVRYAMRYGQPAIRQVWQELSSAAITQVIVLPLFPQYAAATTATVADVILKLCQQQQYLPHLQLIHGYHQHPLFLAAWQQHLSERTPVDHHLLLSYHSLPVAMIQAGDPYSQQCVANTEALKQLLPQLDISMCYQSRFGRQQWLSPLLTEKLEILPKQGIKHLAVACPGFAVDCLETLEEVAIRGKEQFLAAGGTSFCFIPCLNGSSHHADALLQIIRDQGSC